MEGTLMEMYEQFAYVPAVRDLIYDHPIYANISFENVQVSPEGNF